LDKEGILKFMSQAPYPMGYSELRRRMKVPEDEKDTLKKLLKELEKEGALILIKGGRYGLPKRMNLVVSPAKRTFVVVSGGPRLGSNPEDQLRETTRIVMDAGAEGRIIGRNFWGIPIKEAKIFTNLVAEVMKDQRYDRKLREPRFDFYYS